MDDLAKLDKLYYKIGEVSRLTGLEAYVLRYWEKEFPALTPKKNRGRQRIYSQEDIQTILHIKHLLYEEEFTIEGARRQLEKSDKSIPPRTERLDEEMEELRAVLKSVREEIQTLCEMLVEESAD